MFNILMELQFLSGKQKSYENTELEDDMRQSGVRKRMVLFNCGTLDVNYQLYQRSKTTKCER